MNEEKLKSQIDDEIDIMEILQVLIDGKKIIALFIAICIVVAGIASLVMENINKKSSMIIALNFAGIEKGLNPDNSKFSTMDIISPEIISTAIKNISLDEKVRVSDVRGAISVEPIVPKNVADIVKVQRERGNDYSYNPNQFELNLKSSAIKEGNSSQVLDAIVDAYINRFEEKYSNRTAIANIVKKVNYDDYDYPEITMITRDQMSLMKSYLSEKVSEAPYFKSSSTGMTFQDINKSLDVLDKVDLNKMNSLIMGYNVTKDVNKLVTSYQYRIKTDELEKKKSEEEQSVAKSMLSSYKRPNNTLVISGNETQTQLQTNENNESYYDKLVERATNAGVRATDKASDIAYYTSEINTLWNSKVSLDAKKKAEEEVKIMLKTIQDKVNTWIDIIEQTSKDYYDVKYSNSIVKLSPASMSSDVNIKRNILMGAMLGAIIGAFYVIFRKYWKEAKKRLNK